MRPAGAYRSSNGITCSISIPFYHIARYANYRSSSTFAGTSSSHHLTRPSKLDLAVFLPPVDKPNQMEENDKPILGSTRQHIKLETSVPASELFDRFAGWLTPSNELPSPSPPIPRYICLNPDHLYFSDTLEKLDGIRGDIVAVEDLTPEQRFRLGFRERVVVTWDVDPMTKGIYEVNSRCVAFSER
jgi:hypothetical protein